VIAAALGAATAPAAARAPQRARFTIPARAQELIVVSSRSDDPAGHLAALRTYARANTQSPWRAVLGPQQAEIGYSGLHNRRHEGDGSTPTGVFRIGATMYGNDPRPAGLRYAYHRLRCGDWWDEDPFSPRYNHFVHVSCPVSPGFASWSEALWTETVAYPYFAVIEFNEHPVVAGPGAPGSGIFLHSWVGEGTEGCVALPESTLLGVLRWLRPTAHPAIEIGTDGQLAKLISVPPAGAPSPRPSVP
jgi:L,D-peptidoglycan transpeptidase YkuD (ErfK/YbiS/YcfS/YnhG family)